jgi:thiol-activated cytolysin
MQAYYTVDLDAPGEPSALFDSTVRLADVQGKLDERRPPVYVSSVTYGRMVLFTFESQYSAEEMSAALDFAYSGGIDIRGDVSVTYKDIISQSRITAFILGGDAGTAAQTIDSYDALIAFIKTGGNYSRQSPGAPIAYKLSYLKDNSPARMSFSTDYEVKDCVRVSQRIRVTLQSIAVDEAADAGDDLELYGRITAEGANLATLFDKDSDHWVRIHEGTIFGASAPIAEAVIDVSPRPGHVIRLHTRLTDEDSTSGDDNIGDDVQINPFETGWRKDVTMTLTGDGARVRVNFTLAPI